MTEKHKAAAWSFRKAAQNWKDMGIPKFAVEGYLDGEPKRWGCLTEVLEMVADRLEEAAAEAEADIRDGPRTCKQCDHTFTKAEAEKAGFMCPNCGCYPTHHP